MKEPPEVDVVRPGGLQRPTHDGNVQPVSDGVDRRPSEPSSARATRSSIRSVDVLVALEPRVPARDVHSPLLEEVDDDPSDRPAGTDDGDHDAIEAGSRRFAEDFVRESPPWRSSKGRPHSK